MTEFGAIFGEKRIVDWRDETKSKFGGISGMYEIEGFVPDGGAEDADGLSFGDAGGSGSFRRDFRG